MAGVSKEVFPKILWRLILVGAFGLGLGWGAWRYYQWGVNRPNVGGQGSKAFVISQGEGVSLIADRLHQERLINSATLFKIYARLSGLGASLQAGSYEIPDTLSLANLVALLQHGSFDVKLTFIEGWRREEMADYLWKQTKNPQLRTGFLQETVGLEGYLFPDTYQFPTGVGAKEMVKALRANFDEKVGADLRQSFVVRGLSLGEAVIFASLVEREAKRDEDRPLVAAILIKRWQNDWPLEADATVQYAMANYLSQQLALDYVGEFSWWPKVITQEDLARESPYNTRKEVGLPPTPICNPGLASLKAVAEAPATDYWFYLADSEGQTHYAKTLEEHNRLVQQYLGP